MAASQRILQSLGDTVKRLRKERGWTRRELARRAAISERFLADVERGQANPSILKLSEIAAALETDAVGLLAERPVAPDGRRRVVALLGLRGAGKSTIGSLLAEAIGCGFVELDARIEQSVGTPLAEIFEIHGVDFYRRAEREALAGLLDESDPVVIATGGGLVTQTDTFDLLRANAHTVWLKARPEDHWERVVAQGDLRPMEGDDRAFSNLCAIWSERERLYRQADVVADTTAEDARAVATSLAARFSSLACN